MEPEGSLPHSRVPSTCAYREPARSSPYPHIPLPEYILCPFFRCLGCTEVSVRVRGLLFVSQHDTFLRWGVVSTSPNTQAERPPLVGCSRLLVQYIRSCSPYWRPFLHPQPEDAPCRGDRDPLIAWTYIRGGLLVIVHISGCFQASDGRANIKYFI
jgi:hypothetical protein